MAVSAQRLQEVNFVFSALCEAEKRGIHALVVLNNVWKMLGFKFYENALLVVFQELKPGVDYMPNEGKAIAMTPIGFTKLCVHAHDKMVSYMVQKSLNAGEYKF